jgi:hypothetical protein
VARVQRVDGIDRFARAWIWLAFAVWLVVFLGMLLRTASTVAGSARTDR